MENEVRTQFLVNEILIVLKEILKVLLTLVVEKVAPALVFRDDNYVKQIFNISDSTLRRMKAKGILIGAEIMGRDYYTDAYLMQVYEENFQIARRKLKKSA